jgi:hypothetical protein
VTSLAPLGGPAPGQVDVGEVEGDLLEEDAAEEADAALAENGGARYNFARDFPWQLLGAMEPKHLLCSEFFSFNRVRYEAGLPAGVPFVDRQGHIDHRLTDHAVKVIEGLLDPQPRASRRNVAQEDKVKKKE